MVGNRPTRSARVLDIVKRGPSFNLHGLSLSAVKQRQLQVSLAAQYRLWASTWIEPELQHLLPLGKAAPKEAPALRRSILKLFANPSAMLAWASDEVGRGGTFRRTSNILASGAQEVRCRVIRSQADVDACIGMRVDELDTTHPGCLTNVSPEMLSALRCLVR